GGFGYRLLRGCWGVLGCGLGWGRLMCSVVVVGGLVSWVWVVGVVGWGGVFVVGCRCGWCWAVGAWWWFDECVLGGVAYKRWLLGCARLWVGVGPVDVLGCRRGWAGVVGVGGRCCGLGWGVCGGVSVWLVLGCWCVLVV